MIRRLILVVGLGAALVGSIYLEMIGTNGRMLDTQGWTVMGYAITPD
jgi:hypothetical protein